MKFLYYVLVGLLGMMSTKLWFLFSSRLAVLNDKSMSVSDYVYGASALLVSTMTLVLLVFLIKKAKK